MVFCASIGLVLTVGFIAHPHPPTGNRDSARQFIQRDTAEAGGSKPSPERNQWEREGIREEYTGEFTRIVFQGMVGDKGYTYSLLTTPPRLVIDLQEPIRKPSVDRLVLKGGAFRQLRIGKYSDKTRFVLDLRKDSIPEPLVQRKGEDLIVQVKMPPGASDPPVPAQEPAVAKAAPSQPLCKKTQWDKGGIREEYTREFTRVVFQGMVGDKGYTYSLLTTPPRLVIDLQEPIRQPSVDRLVLKGEAFRQLRIGRYPDKVRFVLDSRRDGLPEPLVEKQGEDLIVRVGTSGRAHDQRKASGASQQEDPETGDERKDGLTAAEIRKTVSSYSGGLQTLYKRELEKDPSLQGTVTVMFEIAPTGRIAETVLVSSSIGSESFVHALLDDVRRWKFPRTPERAGKTRVTHPFVFGLSQL
jgi:TonB family protein